MFVGLLRFFLFSARPVQKKYLFYPRFQRTDHVLDEIGDLEEAASELGGAVADLGGVRLVHLVPRLEHVAGVGPLPQSALVADGALAGAAEHRQLLSVQLTPV